MLLWKNVLTNIYFMYLNSLCCNNFAVDLDSITPDKLNVFVRDYVVKRMKPETSRRVTS